METSSEQRLVNSPIFDILIREFGFAVPDYLLRILEISGFDNIDSILMFEESDISEMENFVSSSRLSPNDRQMIFPNSCLDDGELSDNINQTRINISPGHRKLCLQLAYICKKNEEVLRLRMKEKMRTKECSCFCTCKLKGKKRMGSSVSEKRLKNDQLPEEDERQAEVQTFRPKEQTDKDGEKTTEMSVISHIEALIKKYVNKLLNQFAQTEDNNNISKHNIDYTKLKIVYESKFLVKVKCIFENCESICNITSSTLKNGNVKWILSNYNKHLSTVHFGKKRRIPSKSLNEQGSGLSDGPSAKQQKTITSFFGTPGRQSNPPVVQTVAPDEEVHNEGILQRVDETYDSPSTSYYNITDSTPIFFTDEAENQSINNQGNNKITILADVSLTSNSIITDQDPNYFLVEARMAEETSNSGNIKQSPADNKWINSTYSRRERNLRSLESFDEKQLKMTDFFDVVIGNMKKLVSNIDSLKFEDVPVNGDDGGKCEDKGLRSKDDVKNELDGLLKIFIEARNRNCETSKYKNNYKEEIKRISLFIFLVSGRYMYEILYANMKGALPSLATLYRSLDKSCTIEEGVLMFENLKSYLLKRNLPLKIFISEDQTAIVKRICYDPNTNCMVGFVCPLTETGFPAKRKFQLNSVKDVEKAFENESLALNALVVMAQPLSDIAPAFCLTLFGSDNKFNADDVVNRWKHLFAEAQKYGITIEGFASDGDPRCLKGMKLMTTTPDQKSESNNYYSPYFEMNFDVTKPVCFQDSVHICTKLKTRLTKPGISMAMGKFNVSTAPIETLIKTYPKDQHMLSLSYLDSVDKMNFSSIDKLCATHVLQLLDNVPESQSTKQYLKICRFIIESMLNKSLNVTERVYKIWYCILSLRLWRQWLLKNKYSLQKNFITLNAYTCIELNGHSLLIMIEKCREDRSLFLPWLYSSQPCEQIFRQVRSMTTTYSTMVNFSLLEFIRKLNRVQALNDFNTDFRDKIHFPREEGRLGRSNLRDTSEFPTTDELFSQIEKAKADCSKDMHDLGLNLDTESWLKMNITLSSNCSEMSSELSENINLDIISHDVSDKDEIQDNIVDDSSVYESEDEKTDRETDLKILRQYKVLNVKDYTNNQNATNKLSPSLLKVIVNSKEIIIRKSTLCWLYSDERGRLSTDRLSRVRGMKPTQKSKKNNIAVKTVVKTKIPGSESETDPREDSSDLSEVVTFQDNSEDETEDETLDREEGKHEETHRKALCCQKGSYYVVYYDNGWYIGMVTDVATNSCKIKFMRKQLDGFEWPEKEDICEIKNEFIFHGPIELEGIGPYLLKRSEKMLINQKYKQLQIQFHENKNL